MLETQPFSDDGPITLRNSVWYLCIIMGALAFSLWLRDAPADQPQFLLRPVSRLTELLSGVSFALQPGIGYQGVTHSGMPVRIVNLCSGGNFLVTIYLLLVLTRLRMFGTVTGKAALCAGALLYCYGCAVVASSLRVAATVLLTGIGLPLSWGLMHNIVGIATYATMICICYLTAERLIVWICERRVGKGHD